MGSEGKGSNKKEREFVDRDNSVIAGRRGLVGGGKGYVGDRWYWKNK